MYYQEEGGQKHFSKNYVRIRDLNQICWLSILVGLFYANCELALSGNSLCYQSYLRLQLSTPDEKKKKRQLGDVKIITSADGTRLFCCPECHVAYPDKSLLEPHLAGHKIERRWLCGVCGAGLKRKDHLDRHRLCHSEERPFACHACPKAFKRNEHLTQHYMTHSGEKAQVCTDCGKAFYRRDHLRKHLRKHIAACTTFPPPLRPSLTSQVADLQVCLRQRH